MVFFSFLSWFRPWWKTSETDYDSVLSRLTKDIDSVQSRLVHINQRQRRASVTLTLYAFVLWIGYAVFLWFWTAEKRLEMSKGERLQLWFPVFLGLIFILSARYIVRWWYRRIANGEEVHLRSLQRTRRKKIDEIKLATRYDHLRSLLEKYDDTAVKPNSGPVVGSKMGGKKNKSKETTQGPGGGKVEGGIPARVGTGALSTPNKGGAVTGGPSSSLHGPNHFDPTTLPIQNRQQQYQRTWMDRVADKILGAESGGQTVAAEHRYALICRICFTHNGLCPKEEWEEVQYICPRCGTFNSRRPSSAPVSSPWAKSTGLGTDDTAPSPPVSPSPLGHKKHANGQGREIEEDEEEEEEEREKEGDSSTEQIIAEENKENPLRSRRSAVADESLEQMEVD